MGLAASQGRYLALTARNNDLVYEGQQISQQRMALANASKEIADRYNDAMNNKVLQATVIINGEESTQQLSYDLLTNPDPFSGLGMRIVDLNGNIVVPGDFLEITKQEEDKKAETTRLYSADEFIAKYLNHEGDNEAISGFSSSLPDLMEYYNSTYGATENQTVSLMNKSINSYNGMLREGEHTTTDPKCLDKAYLQEMLTTGQWLLQKQNSTEEPKDFHSIVWQGSSKISEVYDTRDDKAAESQYQNDMIENQKRDKILELRLEAIQTEQSAVEKEMESIKEVISKNIEDSFNTFSG